MKFIARFWNTLLVFFMAEFYLYLFWISIPYWITDLQIRSPILWVPFLLCWQCLWMCTKFKYFMKSSLSVFFFCCLCLWGYFWEIIAKFNAINLARYFLKRFLYFEVLCLSPFWVNLSIWCYIRVQPCYFACGYPFSPEPLVEKTTLSALNGFGPLVDNHLTISERLCLWALICFIGLCVCLNGQHHIVFMIIALH